MITILLEIKRNDGIQANQFYTPAIDGFKKYPKTINGVSKAIKQLIKLAESLPYAIDYRFRLYDGKWEYWKKNMDSTIITKDQIAI
jgi:hypothetical protein